MPINWEMYRKEMNRFRIMKNLEDMTMDEVQERMNSGDITFGEMREIANVIWKANEVNESQKKATEAEKEKEQEYRDMKDALYKIKQIVNDVLPYYDEDDEEDW